jgi:hypothetical protein
MDRFIFLLFLVPLLGIVSFVGSKVERKPEAREMESREALRGQCSESLRLVATLVCIFEG